MVLTASVARKELFPLIEKVNRDSRPVEITSKKGRAYLVPAKDFESWQETMYLQQTGVLDKVAERMGDDSGFTDAAKIDWENL